jgi:hypothetical protein
MVGRIPLWVAKQHGHSITTMSRACADGAVEADIEAIQRAMASSPWTIRRAVTSATPTRDSSQGAVRAAVPKPSPIVETVQHNDLSVGLPAATLWQKVIHGTDQV